MQQISPVLHPDGAVASLLSLSMAASNAVPVPAQPTISATHLSTSVGSPSPGVKQHRRLSSTGKARRRLSDARDAANRPSPAALQTAAALSLASLSLSTSPPLSINGAPSLKGPAAATATLPGQQQPSEANPQSRPSTANTTDSSVTTTATPIPINGKHKKRGIDHKCESCSKIYRHPSCLIKHRWEHTPHWKEASKYVLSKHQQVQLLEAAAILSHLSPKAGTSLPEDRSLWPSFLSGGTLPPPEGATFSTTPSNATSTSVGSGTISTPPSYHPVSSSVPAAATLFTRSSSTGPRLHDFSIPGAVTQLRPGLIGVSNSGSGPTPSIPVPVLNGASFTGYRNGSWGGNGDTPSSYHSAHYLHAEGRANAISASDATSGNGLARGPGSGGWSLPHSSLRSISGSSLSQSRSRSGSASASGSRSDDDSLEVDGDIDVDVDLDGGEREVDSYGSMRLRGRTVGVGMGRWKREEDDFGMGEFSVREEDEDEGVVIGNRRESERVKRAAAATHGGGNEEWDDMEMEMDMD
ncbi:hypothetical protein BDN72DRAFT_858693 [Pluteus cervinus]|uniref:Uncharacterized protein n=1 Tax=Pluteus cervinus TaxID=181527 RepID=A0ACD3AT48_9AGAR|nr:hypothetical protein BDN72DRAFT_858693 [Pluteus cervinus]